MEEEINPDWDEMIGSMEHVSDYDGELVMNTVLDNYKQMIKENPRVKKKLHKFLNYNEELRELTTQQRKIIAYCKAHETIKERDVQRLVEINAQKEDIMKKVVKMFPEAKE
jgi:dsDNA-specific endonuclease/ATPase MutS2